MIARGTGGRAHLLLTAAVLLARAALNAAGMPFAFSLDWMWLPDPADLQHDLVRTMWLFHAFPPGMVLLTGLLLDAGGNAGTAARLASWLYMLLAVILVNVVFALGRALGLRVWAAAGLAMVCSLTPAALYFSHLFHYEWPVTTLLCGAMLAFYWGARQPASPRHWAVFFAATALIAITRSTFHLVWVAGMTALALWAVPRAARTAVVRAAVLPLLAVMLVYTKNLAVTGEFAASTFGPASLHLVTVDRLPREQRDRWIADGRLSPYAAVSAYASPERYLEAAADTHSTGPPQLTRLRHPSTGTPNFNHQVLLDVHRARRRDARYVLTHAPWTYVRAVASGLRAYLGPSTEWHPRTGSPAAPHAGHRAILGTYESAYNRAVHGWGPLAPIGMYALLPLVLLGTAWHSRRLLASGDNESRARGCLIVCMLAQVLWVTASSTMLTYFESSRYRFQVEPLLWLLAATFLTAIHGRLSHRRHV